MRPIVQIALDFTDTNQAVQMGRMALQAGADWIEAGYPLVTTQGMAAIGTLSKTLPGAYLLVDFMVIVGARRFIQAAKEQGAHNVTVSALAPDFTVRNCIEEGKKNGIAVTVDLFNVPDLPQRARRYEQMGADYVMVHLGADEKRADPTRSSLRDLRAVLESVSIPVSYASYSIQEAVEAARLGAAVIAQGEPMISSPDALNALKRFVRAVKGVE